MRLPLYELPIWSSALCKVLDLHATRVAMSFDTLPSVVLLLLVFLASTPLAVAGYGVGLTGRRTRWRLTVFALSLAAVIVVVLDFDRTTDGFVKISQTSLITAVREMETQIDR